MKIQKANLLGLQDFLGTIYFFREIFTVWPFILHQELEMTKTDWPLYYFGMIGERKSKEPNFLLPLNIFT